MQIRRRQFGQRIENESAFLHMVVRHLEARFIDQPVTEQYDVEIQRTRPPTFNSLAALSVLDGLQRLKQLQRRERAVEGGNRVGVTRLAG